MPELLLIAALCATSVGCEIEDGALEEIRGMTNGEVAAHVRAQPNSPEAQYVNFMLSPEAGLNPPEGVTERNLLIFGYEECAGREPSPPREWSRAGRPGLVGFDNFVHTARGFAHRLLCPDDLGPRPTVVQLLV